MEEQGADAGDVRHHRGAQERRWAPRRAGAGPRPRRRRVAYGYSAGGRRCEQRPFRDLLRTLRADKHLYLPNGTNPLYRSIRAFCALGQALVRPHMDKSLKNRARWALLLLHLVGGGRRTQKGQNAIDDVFIFVGRLGQQLRLAAGIFWALRSL